jgi:hypothetical protein
LTTLALAAGVLALPLRSEAPDLAHAFPISGTESRWKPYATIQVFGQYYFDQYLYDNGTLVGIDTDARNANATPDRQFSMTARTSSFGFYTCTPTARMGDLVTNLELGFDSGNPGPRGNPKLNQAWLSIGNWLLGYTWSNWLDRDALPETVDASGPIGQTCNDTGRYTQVRYTFSLSPRDRLIVSLEQNQRAFKGWGGADNPNLPGQNTIQPDARYPSWVAAYVHQEDWGQVSLRALGQQYGAYQPAAGSAGPVRPSRWARAVQLSGNLMVGARDNLVYSVYTGQALGVYGFSPQAAVFDMVNDKVQFYVSTGWQAGYTHHWNGRVRSNLIATGVYFRNDPPVAPQDIRRSENYFANTIVKVAKQLEVGMEYGYEGIKTFGPAAVTERGGGTGDNNKSRKLQVAVTAKF